MNNNNNNDYQQELMSYLKLNMTPEQYYKENQNAAYFTFIWNLFENLCCEKNANYTELEKVSINRNLTNNCYSLFEYYNYFKNAIIPEEEDRFNIDGRRFTFKFKLENKPDGTPKNKKDKEVWIAVKTALTNENSIDSEKIKALLYLTYRIRNNFFHGEKDPRSIKYQNKTFQLANKFLLDITKAIKPDFNCEHY